MGDTLACRVCGETKKISIQLDSEKMENFSIRQMLNELVPSCLVSDLNSCNNADIFEIIFLFVLQYESRAKLPEYICSCCLVTLEVAFEFKNKYMENIYRIAQEQNQNPCNDSTDKNIVSDDESSDDDATVSESSSNRSDYGSVNQNLKNCEWNENDDEGNYASDTGKSEKSTSKQPKRYQCKICDRTFLMKGLLQTHLYRHENKPKQYECEQCKRKFLCLPHYREHECI